MNTQLFNKSFMLIMDKIPLGGIRVIAAIMWLLFQIVEATVIYFVKCIGKWLMAILEIDVTDVLKKAYYWDEIKENS